MSVRAYLVKKMICEQSPTFNLWYDEEIMKLLEVNDWPLEDYCGHVYVAKSKIKEALKKAKKEETKEILRKMLKQAKNYDGVEYYCY